jgi:hypothetical protein
MEFVRLMRKYNIRHKDLAKVLNRTRPWITSNLSAISKSGGKAPESYVDALKKCIQNRKQSERKNLEESLSKLEEKYKEVETLINP